MYNFLKFLFPFRLAIGVYISNELNVVLTLNLLAASPLLTRFNYKFKSIV